MVKSFTTTSIADASWHFFEQVQDLGHHNAIRTPIGCPDSNGMCGVTQTPCRQGLFSPKQLEQGGQAMLQRNDIPCPGRKPGDAAKAQMYKMNECLKYIQHNYFHF